MFGNLTILNSCPESQHIPAENMNFSKYVCSVCLFLSGVIATESVIQYKLVADTCARTDRRMEELEEKVRQLQLQSSSNKSQPQADFGAATTSYQRYPRDCKDVFDNGKKDDGVYEISPDGRCPFKVFCDIKNGGWTVIQRRQDGSINFYRGWTDYARGFGELNGEHWLGLENIHRLTQGGSQINFTFEMYDGNFERAHYKAFTVHDVTTAFKMNVDSFGYEGSISELFTYHDNMKFSTFDRDINSCVSKHGGGAWWHERCYQLANVNGVYGALTEQGISYYEKYQFHYVKNTVVSIQRRQYTC